MSLPPPVFPVLLLRPFLPLPLLPCWWWWLPPVISPPPRRALLSEENPTLTLPPALLLRRSFACCVHPGEGGKHVLILSVGCFFDRGYGWVVAVVFHDALLFYCDFTAGCVESSPSSRTPLLLLIDSPVLVDAIRYTLSRVLG